MCKHATNRDQGDRHARGATPGGGPRLQETRTLSASLTAKGRALLTKLRRVRGERPVLPHPRLWEDRFRCTEWEGRLEQVLQQ